MPAQYLGVHSALLPESCPGDRPVDADRQARWERRVDDVGVAPRTQSQHRVPSTAPKIGAAQWSRCVVQPPVRGGPTERDALNRFPESGPVTGAREVGDGDHVEQSAQ